MTELRDQGRAEILGAAAELIAQDGFHGMSMRALARATERGLASLYNYFDSKDDLLFALQAGAFQALLESARDAVAVAESPDARLYAFIANHVGYVAEHRDVMRVLIHEAATLPPRRRREVRALKDAYFALGREVIGALRPLEASELERSTYCLFGTINWVFGWYDPAQHGTPFDVARTIHRMTLCGLAGQEPSAPALARVERGLADRPHPSPIRPEVERSR